MRYSVDNQTNHIKERMQAYETHFHKTGLVEFDQITIAATPEVSSIWASLWFTYSYLIMEDREFHSNITFLIWRNVRETTLIIEQLTTSSRKQIIASRFFIISVKYIETVSRSPSHTYTRIGSVSRITLHTTPLYSSVCFKKL